ncbi:glycosyltransferase 87 family protein [Rugamonas sp. DEMB1]|uniref:glycosyltransferase 87 family protein n=1 Tax=Rugamonas sp. DEMB1 TaxID=3039386 RepID=UPI0024481905|nr:glycosyltransferase 87 family protein [Rugamonas sp. DEMB1]WGG53314.1 glycosyltransferase 87 family protein [Rugamonas sp. DEMB1]
MNLLHRSLAALDAGFIRRTGFLARRRASVVLAVLVPILFGLVSVAIGQDDNWNLRNYHLYNVYALLNERIGFDLAPARFQTYFNPTLDLLYYGLNHWLSQRGAGFVMGALHGLNFVLLLAIARQVAGAAVDVRLALLLAGAGVLGPGFRGELGNTMGDNMTALLVLGALYLILSRWEALSERGGKAAAVVLWAGLLMGLGTGLKLTNAPYAVALCLALFAVPLAYRRRLGLAFLFGGGVSAGVALTGGWWFLKMWQTFGNPLFPQFNNIFHSPWATETAVIDAYFLPKTLFEYLRWPFIFASDSSRVTEAPTRLGMWPATYVLFAVCGVVLLLRRLRGAAMPSIGPRGRFFLLFFGLTYLVWMRMFSIYRYLIPLELLVPLAIWLLWRSIAGSVPAAHRLAGAMLVVLLLCAIPTPRWGNARWGERAYSAEVPAFAQPAQSVVFFANPEPPMAWLATMFPPQVKFIGVDTGFPESPAWRQRMRQAVAERSGPHYVMLGAEKNEKLDTLQNKLAAAQWLGLTGDAAGCAKLDWLGRHVRLQVELRRLPFGGCTFELLPQHRAVDLATPNRAIVDVAAQHLQRFGIALDAASCRVYPAALARRTYLYQLCRATPAATPQ